MMDFLPKAGPTAGLSRRGFFEVMHSPRRIPFFEATREETGKSLRAVGGSDAEPGRNPQSRARCLMVGCRRHERLMFNRQEVWGNRRFRRAALRAERARLRRPAPGWTPGSTRLYNRMFPGSSPALRAAGLSGRLLAHDSLNRNGVAGPRGRLPEARRRGGDVALGHFKSAPAIGSRKILNPPLPLHGRSRIRTARSCQGR